MSSYKSVSRFCIYTQRDVDYRGATVKEYRLEMDPCLEARQTLDRVTDGKLLIRYTRICVVTIMHNSFLETCTLTRVFHVAVLHSTSRQRLLCDVFQQSL